MRLAAVVLAVSVVGCAPADEDVAVAARSHQLRGGDEDAGRAYPFVLWARIQFRLADGGTLGAGCTATRITARSILFAAHCLNQSAAGGPVERIWVTDSSPAPPSPDAGRWFPVERWWAHPGWNGQSVNDLALGLLAVEEGVAIPLAAPVPFIDRVLDGGDVGRPLHVVGYGRSLPGVNDQGTRRAAVLPVVRLDQDTLEIGTGLDAGLCPGDSGGPSLLEGRDGVLRVAGIHSFDLSVGACTRGRDTRVDRLRGSIIEWLVDTEGAGCGEDGLCRAGCQPVDVDCDCVSDGACSPLCPRPLTDPDCPLSCGADGVCAAVCEATDPDCTGGRDGGTLGPASAGCASFAGRGPPLVLLAVALLACRASGSPRAPVRARRRWPG